ncbi:MAG: HAMP domain-containing protein [Gammaproteobacteria bacterium]|nr:HAMP domain-containing protein [Gammaproteobacteria bacterium]
MKKRIIKWLQIKVFLGLGALVFGAASIIFYINLLAQENHNNQQLLSYVKQLDVQGQEIKRRSSTYANNAPREYNTYYRDLVIFYPDFMLDLDAFGKLIAHIAKTASEIPKNDLQQPDTSVTVSITNLQSNWQNFRRGFLDKLGSDLKEPRLEWGADYVQANQQLINLITGQLITKIDNAIQRQLATNSQLTTTVMQISAILVLLGAIWFYFSVIRRISQTVNGCQRVAQGDFGYQLNIRGNDELSALASAFNILSARTRFVVNLISKMHSQESVDNKVSSVCTEATGYLPIEWLGLWHYDNTNNSLELMSMRSERTMTDSTRSSLITATTHDAHLIEILSKNRPIKYSNLAEQISQLPSAKLMLEIRKMGLLNSVLIVPLKSDNDWQGVMVLVASDADSYSDEQIELMANLSPFMANGFES